ncbi:MULTISPECIES: Gfo/Idh/MocA family oxidoreductase [unclassified Roseitalea]|uniref:Gfo/Idh/MocA family protein n=1 Tax=unclassified Roseitalea TaxID=2639107 RepID=UPI00273D8991|nr:MULTISPECIES: Gfo/Idh/MocA family oxidoreductase [unclassified Roseitalea]
MYNVLIVGTGGIGRRHIRGFTETGRALLSYVEPDPARRAEAERQHAPTASHESLEQANLAAHDLAVICAPANQHTQIMLTCARAGLPFLVEKPLAVSLDGVEEVIAHVDQAGLVARVGYTRRNAPELKALRAQVLDGKIGAVKLAYINASQDFARYRPDYRETYYSSPEMGGGAILDAASHSFDALIWILGRPVTVGAMHDRMALEGSRTEDTCLVNIRFAGGAMANLTINQFQKRFASTFEVMGTRGNLMLEHSTLKFTDNDSGAWVEQRDFMDGLAPMDAHQARFAMQANAMLDALEGKPDELATLEEARLNLALALSAKRSWHERRFISLDGGES